MIDSSSNVVENQIPKNKNIWRVIIIAGLIILLVAIVIAEIFIYRGKIGSRNTDSEILINQNENPLDKIVPKNAKSPEDFLGKVQEKSAAIQKNYDSNLTDFAQKRWEKLFRKQNRDNLDPENLKILSPEIQKTADGSTLFKIKFRIKHGDTETEAEDFYYLILSEEKKVELGLNNLKANVFLNEEDIIKNLGGENFAKIEKIK